MYCNCDKQIFEGVGEYDFPTLPKISYVPKLEWIDFGYGCNAEYASEARGCHFFIDDYRFERVWVNPDRYLDVLSKYGAIISPDFSLYNNFPKAVQMFNHYRKQWVGAYYSEYGIKVIPCVAWSDTASLEWAFDGIPENSIIAISVNGVISNNSALKMFMLGFNAMQERLKPSQVLCLSSAKGYKITGLKNVEYVYTSTFKVKPKKIKLKF